MAEQTWLPEQVHLEYQCFIPGFVLSQGNLLSYDYLVWKAANVKGPYQEEDVFADYLEATVRTPEQLLLCPSHGVDERRSPDTQIRERIRGRMTECVEQYIQHCQKTGKYKEYLYYWDQPREFSYGRIGGPFCYTNYSDISIVYLDIMSSETFFRQPPGSSLAHYFDVVFFITPHFLFDNKDQVVDQGPVGGAWNLDFVRPDNLNQPWSIEEFLSYEPRILPFGLQMTDRPSERPTSADFTVTIGYSDGTTCSSTLSASFPY